MKRRYVEDNLQVDLVRYLRAILPDCAVHHSPNGAHMHPRQCAKMKYHGMVPGWPDIEIVAPHGRVYFMEVKRPKGPKGSGDYGGRLSEDQDGVRFHFVRYGVPYAVVRSLDDAKAALAQWRVDTREAAA